MSADAGTAITGASKGLRTTRLRGRNDHPGTGMEPDCAFYVGERARCYRAALADGEAAAEPFFERTPPDLVVEAEIASIDEGKIARYARALKWGCASEAPYGTAPPDDDGTRAC